MSDKPILFSAPMVRAMLDGRKTQTRRLMKPQPELQPNGFYHVHNRHGGLVNVPEEDIGREALDYVRFTAGDRLWVKENGWERPERTEAMMREGADTWEPFYFDADQLDDQDTEDLRVWGFKRRPSIHMRRAFSRLTLHVTEVRVERLQEISESDAEAEGTELSETIRGRQVWHASHRAAYAALWDFINGPGSWGTDPWVVTITYDVERKNIDAARPAP